VTSPTYKLDMNGSIRFNTSLVSTSSTQRLWTSGSSTNWIQFQTGGTSGNHILDIQANDGNCVLSSRSTTPLLLNPSSGGNVGIGTVSPRALLDVSGPVDVPAILTSGASSSEGDIAVLSGEAMQIGHWDNGTSTFTNRIHINSSGNVGIGTNPGAKLDVFSSSTDPGAVPTLHVGDGALDYGDYGMLQLTRHPTTGGSKAHAAFIRSGNSVFGMGFHNNTNTFGFWPSFSTVTNTPAMSFASGGNVGIGTTGPGHKLHIQGDSVNASTSDPSVNNYGQLEISSSSYAGWTNADRPTNLKIGIDHRIGGVGAAFIQGIIDYISAGIPLLLCPKGGNVGIGTTNPGAKLHINGGAGSISSGSRIYFRYNDYNTTYTSLIRNTGTWDPMSIYASDDIVTAVYLVSHAGTIGASDTRIKKNIVDADDAECLEVLRLLKPKKYQYKDEINRGTEPVWGFIAQEVRETLPYATQLRQDVLPNIYELANVSQSNVITFTNFNTSNLESNATTLIRTKGIDGEDHDIHLAEVIDEHTIRVEEDLTEWIGSVDETGNVVAGNQLFIYGQEVDDFVFLKKDAIWTVATSALQEVDRQLQTEKAKVATLETQLASVLARLDALESA
jgi:hypothetical protein